MNPSRDWQTVACPAWDPWEVPKSAPVVGSYIEPTGSVCASESSGDHWERSAVNASQAVMKDSVAVSVTPAVSRLYT